MFCVFRMYYGYARCTLLYLCYMWFLYYGCTRGAFLYSCMYWIFSVCLLYYLGICIVFICIIMAFMWYNYVLFSIMLYFLYSLHYLYCLYCMRICCIVLSLICSCISFSVVFLCCYIRVLFGIVYSDVILYYAVSMCSFVNYCVIRHCSYSCISVVFCSAFCSYIVL